MKEKFGVFYFLTMGLVFLWALIKFWGELGEYKILLMFLVAFCSYGVYENFSKINRR